MNEIISVPCNSLLATFFEVFQKKASSRLRRLIRPKRTLNQLFELLFPLLLISPKRKFLEREARSVLWEVQGTKRNRWRVRD